MDFRNSSFSRLGLCSTVSNRIFAKDLKFGQIFTVIKRDQSVYKPFLFKNKFSYFWREFRIQNFYFDNLFLTNLTQYANYCGWIIVEDYLIGDKMKSWDLRKFKWPYISRCGHVRGIFGKSTKVKFYWKTSFLVVFISLASLH